MNNTEYKTRLERILNTPLADDAVRQWPQSGELVRTKKRISEVESKFEGFKLGIGRRIQMDNKLIVEWTSDYGDGKLHRNVTIADIENGQATKVTDYWGAPFEKPDWRNGLTEPISDTNTWPNADTLIGDEEQAE